MIGKMQRSELLDDISDVMYAKLRKRYMWENFENTSNTNNFSETLLIYLAAQTEHLSKQTSKLHYYQNKTSHIQMSFTRPAAHLFSGGNLLYLQLLNYFLSFYNYQTLNVFWSAEELRSDSRSLIRLKPRIHWPEDKLLGYAWKT